MAVWSSVSFAAVSKEQRFDPEFWQPVYLQDQKATKGWPVLGKYLISTQYGLSREMNDSGHGTPICRMDEIDDLFLTEPSKYAEATREERASLLLNKNDVLFNRTNSTKFVGRTGILKENITAIFASYLIRLIPDASQVLPEYLVVYLNCQTGSRFVKRRAKESINQTNISGSEIRKVPFLVPSRDFQQRIAALIEEAADYRSRIGGFYADAEGEMLERLGWAKLTKQEPELWYLENYHAVASAARCDAEHFQPWLRRLRQHLLKEGGARVGGFCPPTRRGVQPVFVQNGEVWVIDSKAVRPGGLEPSIDERTDLSFLKDPRNAKARVGFGDVLLNSTGRGTLGRAACWLRREPAIADNHVSILRPDPNVCLPVYLALFLNSAAGLAQSEMFQTGSSGQLELYPVDVAKLVVYIPTSSSGKSDLKWQQHLADKVTAANEAKAQARASLDFRAKY